MITSIGVDVCRISRVAAMIERRPGLVERLFTADEARPGGRLRSAASLAARFAAKEALAKALGTPGGLAWTDVEVVTDEGGAPSFRREGPLGALLAERGIDRVHLSLSHDADAAVAMVVCEERP